MKKHLMLIATSLLLLAKTGQCQTKVERFCVIHAEDWTPNFATLKKVTVDYGQIESIRQFKDTTETAKLETVKKCKTESGVLNYMNTIGWTWVSTREPDHLSMIIMVFKKTFNVDELIDSHIK